MEVVSKAALQMVDAAVTMVLLCLQSMKYNAKVSSDICLGFLL